MVDYELSIIASNLTIAYFNAPHLPSVKDTKEKEILDIYYNFIDHLKNDKNNNEKSRRHVREK